MSNRPRRASQASLPTPSSNVPANAAPSWPPIVAAAAAIANESEACCSRSGRTAPVCHARTRAVGHAGRAAALSAGAAAAAAELPAARSTAARSRA